MASVVDKHTHISTQTKVPQMKNVKVLNLVIKLLLLRVFDFYEYMYICTYMCISITYFIMTFTYGHEQHLVLLLLPTYKLIRVI